MKQGKGKYSGLEIQIIGEKVGKRVPCLILLLMLTLGVVVLEFLYVRNSVSTVSAVEATAGIGVYWDAGCTNAVGSINWGVLSPGHSAQAVVYVRNEGNQSIFLTVAPTNYSPANASDYLSFSWACANATIMPTEIVQVTTWLLVSATQAPKTTGNFTFSFDIIFGKLSPDVNGDGKVDMGDVVTVLRAFGSTPGMPNWNPACDLEQNGRIDMGDVVIVLEAFGETV